MPPLFVLVFDAAAAVEQLLHAKAGVFFLPFRGVVDIDRLHAQRVGVVVVDLVRRRVPGVIGREGVVDVHLDVVALVAEVDAARDPVQRAVAQQLGLQLVLVLVEGLDHFLDCRWRACRRPRGRSCWALRRAFESLLRSPGSPAESPHSRRCPVSMPTVSFR